MTPKKRDPRVCDNCGRPVDVHGRCPVLFCTDDVLN